MIDNIDFFSSVDKGVTVNVAIDDESSTVYVNSENSLNPITVIAPNSDVSVITSEQFFYVVNGYHKSTILECPKEKAKQQAFKDKILEMEIEEDLHIIRENAGNINMKKLMPCKKCDSSKPINEFYKSTIYKAGHGQCKPCVRARVNASHRAAHRLAFYASDDGKQAARDKFQLYVSRYPGRHAVRVATNKALAAGKIVKSNYCSECGNDDESKIEAHHDDYNHPLSVRWLCRDCHWSWHNHNTPIYQSH